MLLLKRKTIFTVITICISLLSLNSFSSSEIRIGVLAPRGELKALTQWSEFGKYMENKLGQPVKIVPLAPPDVVKAASNGNVDFVLSHPAHTLALIENHHATTIATLNKDSGPQFSGVIIAKSGSGIEKASDLRGKKVMSLEFNKAAGAYIFQTYHLKQQGIDVHKDFASLKEGKKQDDLVLAVRAGVIDAAFIRSGLLEAMEKEGKIKISDFIIVDKQTTPGFSLLHSTALYPEWYFSAISSVAKNMLEKAKSAVLDLPENSQAAKKAKIKGFVLPLPLDQMKAALKSLKISPYNS